MSKTRTLNELRQTRDVVYTPPMSHQEEMAQRLVGDIYVIMDEDGNPAVACDDVACLIQVRPEWSAQELANHFGQHAGPFMAENGEKVHHVRRKKQRV